MTHEPFDSIPDDDTLVERFEPALVASAAELASLALLCHVQGWGRAAGASFSARAGEGRMLVTAAGRDKESLTTADFCVADHEGRLERSGPPPSIDAPLHGAVYRKVPGASAVALTCSLAATVLSRYLARRGSLALRGYALARAFGPGAPDGGLTLPICKGASDPAALARLVEGRLDRGSVACLLEGQGLMTWGPDVAALRRHVEALEFLLACELAALSLPAVDGAVTRGPPRP
ncbi:MAG TPA: class II aldolase/adducin family protein [Polyangiaceae bacterium]|nr:class II aldolase/adducin family protein [Polyangiaceae bacterium]